MAVVVGGVAIAGGIGTPLGAAVGAVFAGLLNNVAALAGLSDGEREVVACRHLLELTERETAAILGLPRGTIKSRTALVQTALAHMPPRAEPGTPGPAPAP